LATNEVQFSCTWDFSKGVVCQLRVSGVADAEVSSLLRSHVAAFVPESKDCVPQLNASRASLIRFFATNYVLPYYSKIILMNYHFCLVIAAM